MLSSPEILGVSINAELVRRLIAAQFSEWSNLPVTAVEPGGWDNRTFRLGDHMSVRLPSAPAYVAQVEKEHQWLPRLALPLPIPTPLAKGSPAEGYPWVWSIYEWLDGEPVTADNISDWTEFAHSAARFLAALSLDRDTWNRARGWALWKALITVADRDKSQSERDSSWQVIGELVAEYRQQSR